MIAIRADQMQLLLEQVRKTFASRVRTFLRANQPGSLAGMEDADVDAFIRRQVSAAESYGISSESGVVHFIETALIYGEDFHRSGEFPEAERILLRDVDCAIKVQELKAAAERGFAPPND